MELIQKITEVIQEAGAIVLSATDVLSCTHQKTSAADLVTAYDVKVESFLKEKLLTLVPEAIFFGEEETERQDPPTAGPSSWTPSTAPQTLSGAWARVLSPLPC